jgi:hypothetical protein
MTNFKAGQEVIATATAQGMSRFAKYVILDVIERHTGFGTFVTYVLIDELDGSKLAIGNGHLLLADAGKVSA